MTGWMDVINENNKELLGKLLFSLSIIVFVIMLFSPLNNLLYHIDEYFTLGLVKFPIMQGITISANDVHPPFYYLLLKFVLKIFPGQNIVFISKIMTIIPYFIILVISATKIRKEYNWLTAGLLTFSLFAMAEFFRFYLTIRMYSWAILFLLLSFIFLKDVLDKSDLKSWLLFNLFTLLGAYTHYFNAISSIIIYVCLLGYFIINERSEIKKWIVSVICLIIGYCPWLFILLNQLKSVHNSYWIPQINLNYIIECISYYAYPNTELTYMAIAFIFLVFVFLTYVSDYKNYDKIENNYLLMGILLFIMTIIVSTGISLTFKPILIARYLLPAVAVFWLAVSILLGRTKNNKLLIISLFLIMLLGISCAFGIMDAANSYQKIGKDNQNFLNEVNQDNATIICIGKGEVIQFGTLLNNSDVYMDVHQAYGVKDADLKTLFNITYSSDLNRTIDMNGNKDIYIIKGDWRESDLIDKNNLLYKIGVNEFYRYSDEV